MEKGSSSITFDFNYAVVFGFDNTCYKNSEINFTNYNNGWVAIEQDSQTYVYTKSAVAESAEINEYLSAQYVPQAEWGEYALCITSKDKSNMVSQTALPILSVPAGGEPVRLILNITAVSTENLDEINEIIFNSSF